MRLPIYLDYPATTPVDPRVAQKMIPYLTERTHSLGWEAEKAVEEGRAQVAQLVCAEPNEIVWTSGESNNLAIKGVAHVGGDKGKHMVTVKTEHKAVLNPMPELAGGLSTYLSRH